MKRNLFPAFAVFLSGCLSLSAQVMDVDIFDKQELTEENILPKTKKPASVTVKIPPDCDSFGCDLILNQPGTVMVQVETEKDKFKKSFQITPVPQTMWNEPSDKELSGKTAREIKPPEPEFKNHVLSVSSKFFNISYYVLPKFSSYTPDEVNKRIAAWEAQIPNALRHSLRIDIKPGTGGLHVYLDGIYSAKLPGDSTIVSVRITGGTGPSVLNAKPYKDQLSTPEFEAADFSRIANPGAMKNAKVSLKPGFQTISGVPMVVLDGAHSSDLSLVKGLRGLNFTLERDYYMSRTAWERYPESQQSAIPNGYYSDAYILFALDPDPAKDRAFSFRLGRFVGGRVVAFATTDVFLPEKDAEFPENIKKVGDIVRNGESLPLYLGRFKIPCGEILDVITRDPYAPRRDYMDFEFMGRRSGRGVYADVSHRPSPQFKSAVNLFGVTFRRAGVYLDMIQSEPGNIFYNDDVPETGVLVTSVRPGKYTLRWSILDSYGKETLKKMEKELSFANVGEMQKITVPLDMPEEGLYGLRVEILDNGVADIVHDASFALLGKDTRLAEPIESPFGSWYTPHHFGTSDPEIYMRIFHKIGVRRPCGLGKLVDKNGVLLHADLIKKYKLTLNQLGWCGMPPENATDEEMEKHFSDAWDAQIKAFPDCKYVTIYHESYGDYYVPEAHGEKVEATEKDVRFAKVATSIAAWFRKNHPDIKLCYGNNTSSQSLTAALLRCNFKPEYLDFVGIETPGQGCVPERLWKGGTQGTWYAQEVGRTYGLDLKVTGCFEFTMRPERLFDSLHEQAAYFMRDALIGLSYGYETLGISGLNDAGGWYSQTLWGSDGLCRRGPLFYPKPLLLAYSTMTKVLDQIKFGPKTMDTGNLSAYAIEFDRKRGDHVYAFWVPKGESEMTFDFPKSVDAELVDCFGKSKKVSGKDFTLTASIFPSYLIVREKADSVRHSKTISPKPPESFKVAVPFDRIKDLSIVAAPRSLRADDLHLQPGKFEVSEVNDEEMGKCIEIKLIREGSLPDIAPEYIRIDLEKPAILEGTPDELGLWVKGDGGWGKVGFDIQDARGYRYRNETHGNAWEGSIVDFACRSYINFKGWYFMTYPLDAKGVKHRRQVSLGGRWTAEPGVNDPPEYPIQLNAIHVTLRRKTLNPNAMKETPGVIRIKDFGGIVNPEFQLKK